MTSTQVMMCPICCDCIRISDDCPEEESLAILGHHASPSECGHTFHRGCIERWEQTSSPLKCPICKASSVSVHVVRPDLRTAADDS